MRNFLKQHKFHLTFFALCGLIGGWFTGIYSVETLTPDLMDMVLQQVGSPEAMYAITAVQSLTYGIVLGALGIALAKKTGLWRPMGRQRRSLKVTAVLSAVCGVCFIGFDLLFAQQIPFVADSYTAKPTISYCIASVLYGGVIEEIMMRLFLMSLLTLLLWKLLARSQDTAPTWAMVTANLLSALLFAAGHLPATAAATALTPLLVFRCFLMNGSFGLVFGELYRRHGIQYAMAAHAGTHVISKLIWILFI